MIMRDAAKWYCTKVLDVVELYSPLRIVQEAGLRAYAGQRLKPGWSLDLTKDDPETGKPWNLAGGKVRAKATQLITEGKPRCVILSPMCTAFSQMQDINKDRFILKRSKTRFEENGFYYFLNIIDYKLKNTISPLNFERNNIKERILNMRIKELRESIKNDIIENAYENNSVEVF